jgi:hypothetical protein
MLLSRRVTDPVPADPTRPFDALRPLPSAAGMFFAVLGILQVVGRGEPITPPPR